MYRIASINYLLRNQGCGLAMLTDEYLVQDYVQEDYLVLAEYAKAFEKGEDGMPHINTDSSPLRKYSGYLLDYESMYGAGRINIR